LHKKPSICLFIMSTQIWSFQLEHAYANCLSKTPSILCSLYSMVYPTRSASQSASRIKDMAHASLGEIVKECVKTLPVAFRQVLYTTSMHHNTTTIHNTIPMHHYTIPIRNTIPMHHNTNNITLLYIYSLTLYHYYTHYH
jgi:acyl-CoA thioesterase